MNLDDLFQHFRRSRVYLKNVTQDTLRFYDTSWNVTYKNWGITKPEEITKKVLDDLIILWRENGVKPVSVNTYISFLNAFLRWMHEEGYVGQLFKMKKLKVELKPVNIFKDDDVKKIINFKPKTMLERRLWVMVCLLLDTGMRSTECTALRVEQVNLDQLTVIVKGKGQKDRFVPISLEMRKILYEWQKKSGVKQGWLFPTRTDTTLSRRNFIRDIGILCKKIGVTDARLSPHTFRHYFAVTFLRKGGDIYSLSRILGHTSVKVTEVYLRSMGIEDLQHEQQRLSPVARFFKKMFSL
jgi:integrase/recombinase XerD